MGFTHQALAKKQSSMIRAGFAYQASEGYFYTGVLIQLGYASLKQGHPSLIPYKYKDSAFSNRGVMLGVLLGRQWMDYLATELTFEWLSSYAGSKVIGFSSEPIKSESIKERKVLKLSSGPHPITEPIKADLNFYTFGVGLDCMPMLPVSGNISLLIVLGIGYKKANIQAEEEEIFEKEEEIFDSIGWKVIPRDWVRGTYRRRLLL